MTEPEARQPHRPLIWPDLLYEIQDRILQDSQPVYVVGGAVRDALMGRPVTDIDLTVPQGAVALARRIANTLSGDVFVLDSERDVGRALVDTPDGRFMVDVARFRAEDLASDLLDRDFTINAMAAALHGDLSALIDPLNGEQDVRDKVLRRCTPQSLSSDPIRTLRAVRQSVQLGLRIEPQTLKDIHAAVPALGEVSVERQRDEFVRLLALPYARQALRVAGALGLLAQILPEVTSLQSTAAHSPDFNDAWQETLAVVDRMAQVIVAISPQRTDHTAASFGVGMLVMQLDRFRGQLQAHIAQRWANDRPHRALLTLAALMYRVDPAQAGERASALRLSNDERDRLVTMLRVPLPEEDLTPLLMHRFWRQVGAAGIDICLLAAVCFLGQAGSTLNQDTWLTLVERLRTLLYAYFERYDEVVDPPPLLDGGQLMAALDLKSGPVIGRLLTEIREGQVTGEVQTLDEALALARDLLDS